MSTPTPIEVPYQIYPPLNEVVSTAAAPVRLSPAPRKWSLGIISFYVVWTLYGLSSAAAPYNSSSRPLITMAGVFFLGLALWGQRGKHKVAATMLGVLCFVLLHSTWAAVALLVLLVVLYRRSAAPSYSWQHQGTQNEAVEEVLRPVWGKAGEHVAAHAAFGKAGALGAKGEVIVGTALEELTREYPHVRVFHGLRFVPGRDGADIDHVVLIGHRVFFVDAKFWPVSSYAWRGGVVLRDGENFQGGEVKMHGALERWAPLLGGLAQAESLVALAQPETARKKYRVDNSQAQPGVRVLPLDETMRVLREAAQRETPLVDRRLVSLLRREMQSR